MTMITPQVALTPRAAFFNNCYLYAIIPNAFVSLARFMIIRTEAVSAALSSSAALRKADKIILLSKISLGLAALGSAITIISIFLRVIAGPLAVFRLSASFFLMWLEKNNIDVWERVRQRACAGTI